jgi:hypothetical protein
LAVPLLPARRPRFALVDTAIGARRPLVGAGLGDRSPIAFSPDGDRLYAVDARLGRVRAFALDGRPLGLVTPFAGAPVVQLLAARDAPEPASVSRAVLDPPLVMPARP